MKRNAKKTLFVSAVLLIVMLAVSCASTKAESSKVTEKASVVKPVATPAVTAPVAATPAASTVKDEVVSSASKAEEVKEEDFKYIYTYDYEGYVIIVEASNGYGYVTYPSFIADEEIEQALKAFVSEFGDFGVTFKKVGAGKLEVDYAKGLAKADFDYIASVAAESLTWYLDQLFAPVQTKAEPAKVEVAKTEPVTVEPAKAEVAKAEPAKVEVAKAEPAKVEVAKAAPAASPVAEQTKVEEKTKKGMPAIVVILIILVIIAAALYCFFCLYKKLTIKEAVEEIKKVFKKK